MRPWHITWSTEGRLPFFPGEALRLEAVRRLIAAGGDELALYCIVDEHIHVVLYGERELASRRIRAITRSLRCIAAVHLESPRIRPVNGRSHMETVFGYVLRQPGKHRLPGHSAIWAGSCLVDLVGARRLGDFQPCLRMAMPRVVVGDALEAVGLPRRRLEAVGLDQVRAAGAYELVRVAAAALGVALPLGAKVPDVVMAKRVACCLALQAGLSLEQVAEAGGFSWRSARRLATQSVPVELRQAVLLRFALEDRVRRYSRPLERS